MSQIAIYKTVSATTPSNLDLEINKLLKQGWRIFGSPYVYDHGQSREICQAMVRDEIPQSASQQTNYGLPGNLITH